MSGWTGCTECGDTRYGLKNGHKLYLREQLASSVLENEFQLLSAEHVEDETGVNE